MTRSRNAGVEGMDSEAFFHVPAIDVELLVRPVAAVMVRFGDHAIDPDAVPGLQ